MSQLEKMRIATIAFAGLMAVVVLSSFATADPQQSQSIPAMMVNVIKNLLLRWFQFIKHNYEENPEHVLVETIAIIVIIYLFIRPTYHPQVDARLSKAEEEKVIREWKADPLVPKDAEVIEWDPLIAVKGPKGAVIQTSEGDCINFASYSFLGLNENQQIRVLCEQTIRKYGVGSCGPRGFYGTIDVHLDLERAFADWIGTEESILYSDGIACTSSVITSFSKRGDLLICDEAIQHTIRCGIDLSRSNVLYFKHNDMESLKTLLHNIREKDKSRPFKVLHRRFIVVEGLYQNTGDLCPLDEVVALCKEFYFRLILDDSMAVGVLGDTGRGSIEHWGLKPSDVEILCVTLDAAISSVGGICAGSREIIDHQRLSGVGYVFSASSPPYTSTASMEALKIIDQEPALCRDVRENAQSMRQCLGTIENCEVLGAPISPIILIDLDSKLRRQLKANLNDDEVLYKKVLENFWESVRRELCHKEGLVVSVVRHLQSESSASRLRILVTALHTPKHIEHASRAIHGLLLDRVPQLLEFAEAYEAKPEETSKAFKQYEFL